MNVYKYEEWVVYYLRLRAGGTGDQIKQLARHMGRRGLENTNNTTL